MLLASDAPLLKVKELLKGAFGIPEGGAPPLKDGCAHKLRFLGRLSVKATSGLLSLSYLASVARCTECKGYLVGSEVDVVEGVKAHPAPEARPEE
jgi:hypothetical protein